MSTLYLKNISIFSIGPFVAILAQLIFAPVLSRIFEPSDYGILSIFAAITAYLSIGSTLGISDALYVTENRQALRKLIECCLFTSTILGISYLTILFVFQDLISHLTPQINAFYYWVAGLTFLLTPTKHILTAYTLKESRFSNVSVSHAIGALTSKLTVCLGGILTNQTIFLILGNFFSLAIQTILLKKPPTEISPRLTLKLLNPATHLTTLKNHKNFPLYILPSNIINHASKHIPLWTILSIFSIEKLGIYAFASALLSIPITALGSTIKPLLLRYAIEPKNSQTLRRTFTNTQISLSILGSIPAAILFCFGPEIFAFAFGEKWRESGEIAGLLSLGIYFQAVATPLMSIRRALRKEKQILNSNLALFTLRISVIPVAIYLTDLLLLAAYYSIISSVFYLINIVNLARLYQGNPFKAAAWSTVPLIFFTLLLLNFAGNAR